MKTSLAVVMALFGMTSYSNAASVNSLAENFVMSDSEMFAYKEKKK